MWCPERPAPTPWTASRRTDALQRGETYLYDANGNLREVTDRKQQVTTYTYDELDRLTLVTYADQSTTAYTYDAGDRLLQVVDSVGGTITRTSDLLDRLTSETTPEGAVSYTYDAASRRATMTVAGQPQVVYGYDNADRLTGITQGSATVTLGYDAANRRTSLTLPNGVVVEYGYDAASRLTGLTYRQGINVLGVLTYTYDAAGRRIAVGGSWARTGLPTEVVLATYGDTNQVATWAGTPFTYDNNGNLTSDGVRTYTWNARNQLTALAGPVAGSFGYDGAGRRRAKTVGGTATQFLYDGLNPVQELAGGTPTANLLTGLGIDEYLTRSDAGGARSYLTDALGSTVALADGAGAVQTSYTYEPFGGTSTSGASTGNAFGFTGREVDGTGLLYYRARYYDPRLQRFVGEDPIGFAGGDVNVHAYVANNPTNLADPRGLWLDTAIDAGSMLYDVYQLFTGGRKDLVPNLAALAGDVLGAMLPGITGLGSAARAAARRGTRFLPEVTRSGRLTQQGLEHIVSRHWATAGTRGAGHFAEGTTARGLRDMINEALANGAIRPNTLDRPGHIFEYDFGRIIGTSATGNATSMVRIVRAPDGTIITAFPF